jgi:hypothetical protein
VLVGGRLVLVTVLVFDVEVDVDVCVGDLGDFVDRIKLLLMVARTDNPARGTRESRKSRYRQEMCLQA